MMEAYHSEMFLLLYLEKVQLWVGKAFFKEEEITLGSSLPKIPVKVIIKDL